MTKKESTKEIFWTLDKILGTLAFLISLGSFWVLVYQTRLARNQQFASVLPYLEIWPSRGEDYYRLTIVNNGIGPAFIEDIKTVAEGKEFDIDPANFYYQHLYEQHPVILTTSTVSKGRVIPAGQSVEIFNIINSSAHTATFTNMLDSLHFDVRLAYASVYKEKWQVSGIAKAPTALE